MDTFSYWIADNQIELIDIPISEDNESNEELDDKEKDKHLRVVEFKVSTALNVLGINRNQSEYYLFREHREILTPPPESIV